MSAKMGILILSVLASAAFPAFGQASASDILTQNDGLPCQPQKGAGDSYYNSGCCGAPGLRSCATILNPGKGPLGGSYGCTDPAANIERSDPYYSTDLPYSGYGYNAPGPNICNLPWPPIPESNNVLPPGRPSGGVDFTFYVTSDLHFWRTGFDFTTQITHPLMINNFAQNPLPWPSGHVNSLSSTFHSPAAIVIPGDFNTGSVAQRIGAYRLLWERGWNSSSINFPVYAGFGNHDVALNPSSIGWGADTVEDAQRAWDYLMYRSMGLHVDRNSTGCLIGGDSFCLDELDLGGSLNHSWDWEGVHLVMLHTWAGDTDRAYTPPLGMDGLTWLKNDLAQAVGSSGRPVILFQHYGASDVTGTAQLAGQPWGQNEVTELMNVIQNYNVIGLFSGHSHAISSILLGAVDVAGGFMNPSTPVKLSSGNYVDNVADGAGGDCHNDNCAGGNGDFLVVHVTDHYLEIGAVVWNLAVPGFFTLDPFNPYINTASSAWYGAVNGTTSFDFPGDGGVCRKRINAIYLPVDSTKATVSVDPNNSGHILVKNLTSSFLPGSFVVSGSLTNWDFTDTCYQDNHTTYLAATETGIPANGQITIPYSGSASNLKLFSLSDVLSVSPSFLNVTTTPAPITVATLSGSSVPFNFTVDQPWVSLSVNSTTTPATIQVTLVPQSSYSADYLTLTITPVNPAIQPVTVRLWVTVPLQVTSNVAGAHVIVNGVSSPMPYSTAVRPNQDLNLDVNIPVAAGYQYAFQSWSDGQPKQHKVTIPANGLSLSVVYSESDQVTYTISPPGSGSVQITPPLAGGYIPKNTTIQITATPASNYYFSSFGGALAGLAESSPTNLTIGGPTSFTANFTAYPTITVSTNLPAGETATVSTGGTAGTAPQSAQFAPSSLVHLTAPALVNSVTPGVRYQFQQWSDGVKTTGRDITVGTTNATYQATYSTQVLITSAVTPPGSGIVKGDGWATVSSTVTLDAEANPGYAFTGFSGGVTSTSNPLSFTAQTPLTVTGNFAPTVTIVIDSLATGLPVTVDNTGYQTPATFQWVTSSQHNVTFGAIIAGTTGVRYQFSKWKDSGDPYVRTITVGSATTYTAVFTTEYLLTAVASPADAGSVTGGGWYNAGAPATLQATPLSGFSVSGFSGDMTSAANPFIVNVKQPLNMVANFAPTGVPALYAAPNGAASDSNGQRIVPLILQNTGSGGALAARVDSITAITVVSGSGTVSPQSGPFPFGDIPAGGSIPGSISLTWPESATRVRMTVNFSANNGAYHGSTTLNLFR